MAPVIFNLFEEEKPGQEAGDKEERVHGEIGIDQPLGRQARDHVHYIEWVVWKRTGSSTFL